MKKRLSLVVAVALAGIGSVTFDNLHAQNDTGTAAPPAAPASPVPGNPQQPAPIPGGPRVRRPLVPSSRMFMQTVFSLRHAKLELEHTTNDFNGHRQSAIDACAKAITELEAIQASEQAAAQAAAAKATNAPPPTTAPAVPQ